MSVRTTTKQAKPEGLSLVRVLNEQAVLETILRNHEISRPTIARQTGLSLPTVVSLVASLESIGLVRKQGMVSGAVGRPATLYSVNPRAGYAFAVDLGGTKIRAGIADLFGEIIAEATEPTTKASSVAIMEQLTRLHHKLLKESGFDIETAGVACVGVPGVWDPKTDIIDVAYNLPVLGEVPLQATIQRALGLPIVIENDVNLAAIGESWKGRAQEDDTFVAFFIGTGIGMGIVIDGEIYRGRSGAAGEIGLLPVGPDPYDPDLRAHGPFETAASGPSIITRLHRALAASTESALTPDADIAQIITAAEAGDEVARGVLDDEARTIAIGVAAVVAVLDPALVILGGGVGAHAALADLVYRYAAQLVPWMPPIGVSALGNRAGFYGAIALGLQAARKQVLIETRSNA